MRLIFDECDFGDDFEAICDPPKDWTEAATGDEDFFIWFKAYDSGMLCCKRDRELNAEGYKYDCLAWVEFGFAKREYLLEGCAAKTREDAERLLQAVADAIYQ